MTLTIHRPEPQNEHNVRAGLTHTPLVMELLGGEMGRDEDKRIGVQLIMRDGAGQPWVVEMDMEALDMIGGMCGAAAAAILTQPENIELAGIAETLREMAAAEYARQSREGEELTLQWRAKRATEGLQTATGGGADRDVDAPLPLIERAMAIRNASGRRPPGWKPRLQFQGIGDPFAGVEIARQDLGG